MIVFTPSPTLFLSVFCLNQRFHCLVQIECDKFHEPRAIADLVGLIPQHHHASVGPKIFFFRGYFVGPKFFLMVFRGCKTFSRRYFIGPKFFFVGISSVRSFFSQIFCRSKFFSREFCVSSKLLLVGISWIRNFISWVFCVPKIFSSGYFLGPKFFLVGISWGTREYISEE